MSNYIERYQKRRLLTSYFSVIVSIALVLFLLGILSILVVNTKKLADHFKEQITLTVFLKDAAKPVEIEQLKNSLIMAEYTKSAIYVTKEEAAELMKAEIGENFEEFLGYNPLKNSFDLSLKSEFVSPEAVTIIAEELQAKPFVEEVTYDNTLITLVSENVKKVGFWLLVFAGIFTVIAVLLINSSIRLSIYSKRFIIKTMQMVGATKKFIRRPFIWTHVKLGFFGALLALFLLGGLLLYIDYLYPELGFFQDLPFLLVLVLGILMSGVLITATSTYFATQRFLNLRTNALYF